MIELKCATTNYQNKYKIFFSCHKDDFIYFEDISKDLLKKHNCAIFYLDDTKEITGDDLEDYKLQLAQMQLFVFPITTKFLTEKNRALDLDFQIAQKNNAAILPIMFENGLANLFKEKCGRLQYLNKIKKDETAISYEKKLLDFLNKVFINDELMQKIKDEFNSHIFLSYRKKDRMFANKTIKQIHSYDFAQDVAIWYDEFLTPGEDYSQEIKQSLKNSNMVAMVVTPNLVNESNYVMNEEYPDAVKQKKVVLPIENIKTNKKQLKQNYKKIPKSINLNDSKKLAKIISKTLKKEVNLNPEHNYYIGLAYIYGIGVEIDKQKGISLIEYADKNGINDATRFLAYSYRNGSNVKFNTDKAIYYTEKLCGFLKQEAKLDNNGIVAYAEELSNLLDCYNAQGNSQKTIELYNQLSSLKLSQDANDDLTRQLFYWQTRAGSTAFSAFLQAGNYEMAKLSIGKRHMSFLPYKRKYNLTFEEKCLEIELELNKLEYTIESKDNFYASENDARTYLTELLKMDCGEVTRLYSLRLEMLDMREIFKVSSYYDCISSCKDLLGFVKNLQEDGLEDVEILKEPRYMILQYLADSYFYVKKFEDAIKISNIVVDELYNNGQTDERLFNIILLNHCQTLVRCYSEIKDQENLQKTIEIAMTVGQKINAPKYNYFTGKTNVEYRSGAKYEGELLCGLRNGYGTNIFTDGCKYVGQWKYNKRCGCGKEFDPTGNIIYDGEWQENVFWGKGKNSQPHGGFYEGDWVKGKKEGYGKFLVPTLLYYEGEFKNNAMQGKGKIVLANSVYEGEFFNNMRHGYGKEFDQNGNLIYEGQWKNNNKAEN